MHIFHCPGPECAWTLEVGPVTTAWHIAQVEAHMYDAHDPAGDHLAAAAA